MSTPEQILGEQIKSLLVELEAPTHEILLDQDAGGILPTPRPIEDVISESQSFLDTKEPQQIIDATAKAFPEMQGLADIAKNDPEFAASIKNFIVNEPTLLDAFSGNENSENDFKLADLEEHLQGDATRAVVTKVLNNAANDPNIDMDDINKLTESLKKENIDFKNIRGTADNISEALQGVGFTAEEADAAIGDIVEEKISSWIPELAQDYLGIDGSDMNSVGAALIGGIGGLMTSGFKGGFKGAFTGAASGAVAGGGLALMTQTELFQDIWSGLKDFLQDMGMDSIVSIMNNIEGFDIVDFALGLDGKEQEVIAPRDNPHPDIFVPEEPALPEDPALIGEVQTLPEQTTGINVAENQVAGSVLPEEQSHTGFASTDYAGLGANMSERIAASSAAVNTGENPMATASGQSSVTPATSRDFAMAHNGEIQTANLNHAPVEPQMNGTTGVAYTANTL